MGTVAAGLSQETSPGLEKATHHELTARKVYSLWVVAAKENGEPVHDTLGEFPETSHTLVSTWYTFASLLRNYTRSPI